MSKTIRKRAEEIINLTKESIVKSCEECCRCGGLCGSSGNSSLLQIEEPEQKITIIPINDVSEEPKKLRTDFVSLWFWSVSLWFWGIVVVSVVAVVLDVFVWRP